MRNSQANPHILSAVPLPPMPPVEQTLPPEAPFSIEVPECDASIFHREPIATFSQQRHVPVHIAPLWRLLCAGLVDGGILAALAGLTYSIHLWLHAPEDLHLIHSTGLLDSYRGQALLWSFLLVTLLGSFYNGLCALKHGQTIGRMLMGIVLIPEDHKGIGAKQAISRSFIAPLSLFCLGAGYFWAIIDKKSRTWHDLASGTVAVYRKVSIPRR